MPTDYSYPLLIDHICTDYSPVDEILNGFHDPVPRFNCAMTHLLQTVTVVLLAASVSCSSESIRYDNHRLYGLRVRNVQQIEALRQLDSAAIDGYTFWNEIRDRGDVDLMVSPEKLIEFDGLTRRMRLTSVLKLENVQE